MSTSLQVDRSSRNLDVARNLKTKLESTQLRIRDSRPRFEASPLDNVEEWPASRGSGSGGGFKVPEAVAADVASQMSFLRKLKWQYLEQNAKDKYVKTIVNDEAPMITADHNAELQMVNAQKKEALKAAKQRLGEKHQDIRRLAPLVEHDYNKAKSLTDEAVTLTQSILDARLAITRLRQAHPQPRLTIPLAEEHLSVQIEEMQTLEDELQNANDRVGHVKESVKDGAKEVERLRLERAEAEKEVKARRDDAEDERVVELYDWFNAALALHRNLLDMQASHSASENELHLTYNVDNLASPDSQRRRKIVTIVLLFLPNTRQLADVQVEGLDEVDMKNVISAYVQANDAPGVIWAIVERARSTL
ncbi:hypothetical protein FA95DRAFT_322276 [Auriscalpium vulgare]|uniref:Uncharacterized protein n=1 Tax=Auriscalpium vulgare TaxID=40419 RepID=A0ACB8S484_9AGAM|nr:hypothetical protein FA95DRAFT_322276 [Auriscalpium vulgare]